MPHRSNQAVASQDRAAPQPPDLPPAPPRRWLIGWATALAALGVSTALLAIALWFARFTLAEWLIGAALAERGAEADFDVVRLDFGSALIRDLRIGSEAAPDAQAAAIELGLAWRGLGPSIESVVVREPRLRLRIDDSGQVSAGALDRLRGRPGARRPEIPELALTIEDGRLMVETPSGPLQASFASRGVLGEDFFALARLEPSSRDGEVFALDRGRGELIVVSRDDTIAFRLDAEARSARWRDVRLDGAALRAMGRAPLDLSRFEIEAAWRIDALAAPRIAGRGVGAAVGGEAITPADALAPDVWSLQARAHASSLSLADNDFFGPRLDARAEGRGGRGAGEWRLAAETFAGLALTSQQPSAEGAFTLDLENDGAVAGEGVFTLARSRLDPRAQERIRRAFPNIPEAPVGPSFARAEQALDRAADRFDLVVPLALRANENGAVVSLTETATARAATGAALDLAPLRASAPALTLQWPSLALQGAAQLRLRGGGAPTATFLVDTLSWAPRASFDATGTISLADWRSGAASIEAEQLDAALAIAPDGDGAMRLRGAATVTGPLGEGEVRNMSADLDLAIAWGDGWSVANRGGCLPIRLGGLDAAGLSFSNGRFALCDLGGALIAADSAGRLRGGFVIRALALGGRLAGPDAQPARLSAASMTGRFGGVEGDVALAVTAERPTVSIVMGEDRTLNLVMRRLTANARIADSWAVEGAFDAGRLSDPSLPGSVSAIAGRWRAAPVDGEPTIEVHAAEALLEADEPASLQERPLFHALRLADVEGVLRDGRIDAEGLILLERSQQQLARFTATHDVSEGAGRAQVRAERIVFGEALQPYDLSELARGLVDNVRGPASLVANIVWTRADIDATARIRLDGVSLSTSTIPIVRDVRGEVFFDDAFALTTPPGQQLAVGLLDPGVAVENGRVRFQLLADGRVAIEDAAFAFAGGVLAMQPTEIQLGADETEFVLTLRDVDAARLVDDLNVPDVSATGRVEGTFPLRLTRRSAFIDGGVLRAQPGGGVIAYSGEAGENATGPARVAFDALREFRYDALSLTLDGDLNGEVVSMIEFSGENTGRPVDLGEISAVPGVGRVTVRGVPFVFNVTVTAPFRRLAETAASITDPGALIRRAEEPRPQEPVDPDAPPPG